MFPGRLLVALLADQISQLESNRGAEHRRYHEVPARFSVEFLQDRATCTLPPCLIGVVVQAAHFHMYRQEVAICSYIYILSCTKM